MVDQVAPAVAFLSIAGALLIIVEQRLHRTDRRQRRADWLKFSVFVLLIAVLLGTARLGRAAALGLLLAIVIGAGIELYRTWRFSCKPVGILLGVILLSIALSHLVWGDDWVCTFSLAVLFVATTDAFSQLWGRLLGSCKLCPRLSPNKTLEGLLGGLLTTASVAMLMGFLNEKALAPRLIVLGLLTAVAGTAGDLLFSAFKRTVGTKDFSRVLPGQGGVLDRFDSLITAAPVLFWSKAWLLG